MSATVQHEVIEALVDLWTQDEAIDVPVYDGANTTEEAEFAGVWVGYDPTSDTAEAVESEQSYAEIGSGRRKNEEGLITCSVAAWSGDDTTTKRRQRVAELLSALEASLRADISLGDRLIDSNFGERITLHQTLTPEGNEVFALFTVRYRARI
jgi:hypothetical protein